MRSDKSNLFYIPTDCPQREKNGWTADASLSAEQFIYTLGCENTLREWLRNICKTQRSDGMLPGIIPTTGWGYDWGNGPAWDSVIVEVPYQIYRFTGNVDVIKESIDTILLYFQLIKTKMNSQGLVEFGLGDWCEAESQAFHIYSTPVEYTNALTLINMTEKTMVMLKALGEDRSRSLDDVMTLRNELILNYRKNYVINGRITVNTQTALAMAVVVKDVLTADEKQTAGKELIELLNERNNRLKVGVIGAKYLFDALTVLGENDRAVKVIIGPDFPSYGYLIENGATTLWEAFMKLSPKGELERENGERFDSINHHFWGSVVAWFYRVIAGINIIDSDTVEIKLPDISSVSYAEASWRSGDRFISVKWEKLDGKVEVTVTNTGFVGNLVLPDRVIAIPICCFDKKYHF